MMVTGRDLQRIYLTGSTPRVVTVACVCGGTIRGNRFEPAQAVAAHNRSNRHKAWRVQREIALELPGLAYNDECSVADRCRSQASAAPRCTHRGLR